MDSDFARNLQYKDVKKQDTHRNIFEARVDSKEDSAKISGEKFDSPKNSKLTSFFKTDRSSSKKNEINLENNHNTCIATGNASIESRIQENNLMDKGGLWS